MSDLTEAPSPPPLSAPLEFQDSSLPLIQTEDVPLCAVCSSEEFRPFASGFDYEIKTNRNQWHFVKCVRCGHVWLNPRPGIGELSTIYPKTYYAYSYDTEVNAVARAGKAWLDSSKINRIVSRLEKPVASYVDVGCGDGRFLKVIERRGVPKTMIYGLELDRGVVGRLTAQGYQVFCERVEDCTEIPENSIDLITMFHVIEHVDHPELVVQQLARWLRPGGILALETPNLDSIDAKWFGKTFWGGYHIPRHWHLFYPETLARLLSANGLKPMETRFQTGHSFWMYSMHHSLRYSKGQHVRLSRLFNPFKSLVPLAFFTGLDKMRAFLGQKTSAMLMLARKE